MFPFWNVDTWNRFHFWEAHKICIIVSLANPLILQGMITLDTPSNFIQELAKLFLRNYSCDSYKLFLYNLKLQGKVSKLSIYNIYKKQIEIYYRLMAKCSRFQTEVKAIVMEAIKISTLQMHEFVNRFFMIIMPLLKHSSSKLSPVK